MAFLFFGARWKSVFSFDGKIRDCPSSHDFSNMLYKT